MTTEEKTPDDTLPTSNGSAEGSQPSSSPINKKASIPDPQVTSPVTSPSNGTPKESRQNSTASVRSETSSTPAPVTVTSNSNEGVDEGPSIQLPRDEQEAVKDGEIAKNEPPVEIRRETSTSSTDNAMSDTSANSINGILTATNEVPDNTTLPSDESETSVSPTSERAKKNFSNAFGAVRGFLARSKDVVVEKIQQKLEEMDEAILAEASDDEVYDKQVTREARDLDAITKDDATPASPPKLTLMPDKRQQREELLEGAAPPPPPKDKRYTIRGKQEVQSSQQVLAETMQNLNERGDKLGELGDKVEGLSNSSSEFAKLAKELAQREANKKWYQRLW